MHTKLQTYINKIKDQLGLKDWCVIVTDQHCDQDCQAWIRCTYGKKEAYINLSKDWNSFSKHRQREVIIHELLHCHFDNAASIVKFGERQLYDCFLMMFETGIDGIAVAIAHKYPLP